MTLIALKCPHCHSELVGKHGIDNGKQRYICKNPDCPHTTFFTEYTYNACKPGVKEAVRKLQTNGGRSPFDVVLMFKIIVLKSQYNLSDDMTE